MADEPADLVAVSTSDNDSDILFFEVTETRANREADGWHEVSTGVADAEVAKAGANIEQVVARVRPIAAKIVAGLKEAADGTKPSSVEVSLGVKLSGEVGFFVAKSSGEASISIKIGWNLA